MLTMLAIGCARWLYVSVWLVIFVLWMYAIGGTTYVVFGTHSIRTTHTIGVVAWTCGPSISYTARIGILTTDKTC